MMDNFHPPETETKEMPAREEGKGMADTATAEEWREAREQAAAALKAHTEAQRLLLCQMRQFNHHTPVEAVMQAQARSEALRWLTQRIEREVQQLEAAYRAAVQREGDFPAQAGETAV